MHPYVSKREIQSYAALKLGSCYDRISLEQDGREQSASDTRYIPGYAPMDLHG